MTKSKKQPKMDFPNDAYGRMEDAPVIRRITARSQKAEKELKGFCRKNSEITALQSISGFNISYQAPINPGVRLVNMNPALPDVIPFPQARPTANSYEQYRFRKLVFRYIPETTTTTAGSVVLCWDRDPLDPIPFTFAQMSREGASVSTTVYRSCELHLPPSPWMYVRDTREPSGADLKTYDYGNLYVGFTGTGFVPTIGRIVVDYELDFRHPTVNTLSEPTDATNPGLMDRNSAQMASTGTLVTTGAVAPLGNLIPDTNGLGIFDIGGALGVNGVNIPSGLPFEFSWRGLIDSIGANPSLLLNLLVNGNVVSTNLGQQVALADVPVPVEVRGICPAIGEPGGRNNITIQAAAGTTPYTVKDPNFLIRAGAPGGRNLEL